VGFPYRKRFVMKRKICVVITARASYSRIKTALHEIQKHHGLELQLIVGSSAVLEKYGSVINMIESDGFSITARLSNVLEGNSHANSVKTTALAMLELSTLFENLKPDMVVTIADRFETLATAVASAYMNVPLVHVQGGELSGNIDNKVRHAITQFSDIHLVSTEAARMHVIQMGAKRNNVFNTGCPSIDIAAITAKNPTLDFDPFDQYGGVGTRFESKGSYLIVMQHPVTNEANLAGKQIECTLRAIEKINIPTFWFWPNPDPGTETLSKEIRAFRERTSAAPIHFFRNMESHHFLKLLSNALCLVGNSSAGIRECSFLGIPVVNIGSRQTGRERGNNVIDVEYDTDAISRAIGNQLIHGRYPSNPVYGNGAAGKKIAALLAEISLVLHK
jgi:UDP-hydrolysing UDP-N-acetyl-D-glucosamine 2-epimerase